MKWVENFNGKMPKNVIKCGDEKATTKPVIKSKFFLSRNASSRQTCLIYSDKCLFLVVQSFFELDNFNWVTLWNSLFSCVFTFLGKRWRNSVETYDTQNLWRQRWFHSTLKQKIRFLWDFSVFFCCKLKAIQVFTKKNADFDRNMSWPEISLQRSERHVEFIWVAKKYHRRRKCVKSSARVLCFNAAQVSCFLLRKCARLLTFKLVAKLGTKACVWRS